MSLLGRRCYCYLLEPASALALAVAVGPVGHRRRLAQLGLSVRVLALRVVALALLEASVELDECIE
jgi:hypothetical protein